MREKKPSGRFSRKSPSRHPESKVLIVTEGKKTEVFYFRACAEASGVASCVTVTHHPDGASPDKVLEQAEKLAGEAARRGSPYGSVYCVMDQDAHSTFDATLHRLKTLENFQAICSYPSFEYWFLLHFEYTRSPFVKVGRFSPGDCVVKALRKHWPQYEKQCETVWAKLQDRLPTAKKNAQRARKEAKVTGEPNPSTQADQLVEALKNLRS